MDLDDERSASILTDSQRAFLLKDRQEENDGDSYYNRSSRTMRTRIRERVRNAFADFWILYNELPEEDREMIFDFPPRDGADAGMSERDAYKEALAAMIAFVYRETKHREDAFKFDRLLEDGVRLAEDEPLLRFTFEIDVDDPWEFDELADKVAENGINSLNNSEMRAFILAGIQEGVIDDISADSIDDR